MYTCGIVPVRGPGHPKCVYIVEGRLGEAQKGIWTERGFIGELNTLYFEICSRSKVVSVTDFVMRSGVRILVGLSIFDHFSTWRVQVGVLNVSGWLCTCGRRVRASDFSVGMRIRDMGSNLVEIV